MFPSCRPPRRASLGFALLVLLLVPSSTASANVLRAENILPPGQSGHVALTGLTNGTGSPHLYDQLDLFTSFRWKPMMFDQPAASTETPKAGVTITRDAFGVPSIRAGSAEDAWWGAGYAVAQDRLFQIELFRRATTGRLAEILGTDYLDDDLIARRDFYTADELRTMFRSVPTSLQARARAYREGVNTWVQKVRSNPSLLPGEFAGVGISPGFLTEVEQAAIGVFLARTIPSGDGRELNNLVELRAIGSKAFEQLVPIRQSREVYTVPPSEDTFPNQLGRTRKQERSAFKRSLRASAAWDVPSKETAMRARARVAPGLPGQLGGSYMFAARRTDGHAVLFNGPQLGYSAPELFVEFELHYPGTDLRGVTAAGVPVIGIGHNGKIAWGITSGLSDEDDLYAEDLQGDGPNAETYRFKGADRKMECRTERFAYASRANALLGGGLPESGSRDERICRTVHGPVQVRAGGTAYARRYAIWGRELETLAGIAAVNDSSTVQDVDRALAQVTWNENLIAIDSRGQIGYWHPGLHQLRPRGYDERLPYPGTGEAEWRGFLPVRARPRVINPKQGWLANWNNLPAKGWTTGDAESNERLSGPFHRGAYLQRLVAAWAKSGASYEGAQDLIRSAGTTAQQRPLAEARLKRAARGATGRPAETLAALLAWDGSYARVDGAGTVDPGVAIWEQFKTELQAIALERLGGRGGKDLAGGTGGSHAFDISNGEAYALRTATPAELRTAAQRSADALEKRFGTPDISRWREPRRTYKWTIQGVMAPGTMPFFDRGTYEQFAETGP